MTQLKRSKKLIDAAVRLAEAVVEAADMCDSGAAKDYEPSWIATRRRADRALAAYRKARK